MTIDTLRWRGASTPIMNDDLSANNNNNNVLNNPEMIRKVCDFSIMWYFKSSDTYNLLVIVSNDVSSHLEVIFSVI